MRRPSPPWVISLSFLPTSISLFLVSVSLLWESLSRRNIPTSTFPRDRLQRCWLSGLLPDGYIADDIPHRSVRDGARMTFTRLLVLSERDDETKVKSEPQIGQGVASFIFKDVSLSNGGDTETKYLLS
ncbi:hypothetical protein EDB84DRAFT_172202 [Lactarius hengduanensis]|nr:hypothetical protein EDB84DRAFT_172202 [Lactarius hengduanensis]